jgi:hypothetical protein
MTMAMARVEKAKGSVFQGGSMLLGAILTAIIGIPAGIYIAKEANTTMIIQQQRLDELQAFENTGAQLDNGVAQLSDAIVDGRGQVEARRDLRRAVVAHSSAVFALRDGLGNDYKPYMTKMVELREFADGADTAPEGVQVWQSLSDLVAMRKRLADRIKAEATQ